MTESIVTGAGHRVTKTYGDRRFVLRAPTFGEAGILVKDDIGQVRPSQAIVHEEIRAALKRLPPEKLAPEELPAMVAAVDEMEEALDERDALRMAAAGDDDKSAMVEVHRRVLKASRGLQRAEWLVRGDAGLIDVKAEAERMHRSEILDLLVLTLESWEGDSMPARPDTLTADWLTANLLNCDLLALGTEAQRLLRPSREQAGNSAPPSP